MNFGEHNKAILQYAAMRTVDGLLKSYNNTGEQGIWAPVI